MKDDRVRSYLDNLKQRVNVEKENRKLIQEKASNLFKIAIYDAGEIYDVISYLVSTVEGEEYRWEKEEIVLMWHFCNIVYLTKNNQEALKEIETRKRLLEWKFAYPDKVKEAKKEFFQMPAVDYVQLNYLYDTFSREYLLKVDLSDFNIVDEHFKYINLFLRMVIEKGILLEKRLNKLELYELANGFIDAYRNNKELKRSC